MFLRSWCYCKPFQPMAGQLSNESCTAIGWKGLHQHHVASVIQDSGYCISTSDVDCSFTIIEFPVPKILLVCLSFELSSFIKYRVLVLDGYHCWSFICQLTNRDMVTFYGVSGICLNLGDQVMAWCMFGTKPLPKPVLEYCNLDHEEQTRINFFYQDQRHILQ